MKFLYHVVLIVAIMAATSNLHAHNGVMVSPKLYLKGALEPNGLMRDALRTKGLLPTTEPYSSLPNFQHYGGGGDETITNPNVLAITGNNAIVDWVVVELRSDNNLSAPVATHSALLQRDGDVVSVDGISPVRFINVAPGHYHVSVRHRNHLGVMTANALDLTNVTTEVDFTSTAVELFGTNACEVENGKRLLWLGDINRDKRVIYQGPGNDRDIIFFNVVLANGNLATSPIFIVEGYSLSDLNLDGNIIYSGPNNDSNYLLLQIVTNIQNGIYGLKEQIPD